MIDEGSSRGGRPAEVAPRARACLPSLRTGEYPPLEERDETLNPHGITVDYK